MAHESSPWVRQPVRSSQNYRYPLEVSERNAPATVQEAGADGTNAEKNKCFLVGYFHNFLFFQFSDPKVTFDENRFLFIFGAISALWLENGCFCVSEAEVRRSEGER